MKKLIVLLSVLLIFSLSAVAEIRKREEPVYTNMPDLQCKKLITDTDWKPNGRAAAIKVNKVKSTFHNCKLVWSTARAPANGEWA